MMSNDVKCAIRDWLALDPVEIVEEAALDTVFTRRFGAMDRGRFNQLWCEVARILRASPVRMHEDDPVKALAQAASSFPYTVMEQIADFVADEGAGIPDGQLSTVGELLEWVLTHPRVEK